MGGGKLLLLACLAGLAGGLLSGGNYARAIAIGLILNIGFLCADAICIAIRERR
jgi:hypothetical protein